MFRRLSAEFFGTFWLVFGGCGSALLAAGFPGVGIGFAGVSLAFGLTVLTMAYAVGGISGGHFNPAVSLGLAIAGRFDFKDILPYWAAQLIGGAVGAAVLYLIASGHADFAAGGFASNGYDALSPGGYSMFAALIAEIVLTALFLVIILGATSKAAPAGFAPLAIGLGLTLIHQISIPVDNTSVNPARSIAAALFAQNGALGQVWLFIVAPLIGGVIGAVIWRYVLSPGESPAGVGQAKYNLRLGPAAVSPGRLGQNALGRPPGALSRFAVTARNTDRLGDVLAGERTAPDCLACFALAHQDTPRLLQQLPERPGRNGAPSRPQRALLRGLPLSARRPTPDRLAVIVGQQAERHGRDLRQHLMAGGSIGGGGGFGKVTYPGASSLQMAEIVKIVGVCVGVAWTSV